MIWSKDSFARPAEYDEVYSEDGTLRTENGDGDRSDPWEIEEPPDEDFDWHRSRVRIKESNEGNRSTPRNEGDRTAESNEEIPPPDNDSFDSHLRTEPQHDGPPRPELDPVALHGLPGTIVNALTPITEADPVGLLLSLLTAFGNAIAPGGGPYVRVGGARHPARLFTLLVGETAKARKGTSWSDTAPPLEVADPIWRSERVVSGLTSGEGLIFHVRDAVEKADGTMADEGVSDKRLFALEEEFSRVLANIRREGSTLSAVMRSAWDGAPLQTLTKNSPMKATGAHVSVLAHITTEELLAKLTEVDMANGLANRFIFAEVRRRQLLPDGGYLDDGYRDLLGTKLQKALDFSRKQKQIERTDKAAVRWRELYQEMADDDPGGMLGAITARAEPQVLRLSLIYALLDMSPVIDVDHLEAAWALWTYSRDSVEHIFGDAVGDEVADRLLRAIRRAGPAGLDSTGQYDVFDRNISAARLGRAREKLQTRGLIETRTESTGTRGRPRIVSTATKKRRSGR